ncbi:GAF domain-containing sensor histidine kinase [Salinibius halmophilus]|uniref:GAF domain-containing sensor histidine kinase n=1 Tax=Salinibius halmophilus TaxID=1853216 RepID=UPI000E66EE5A|nr:HAMP domain-containing sensor histidine kinase [Salinibius halmophilus]
MAEDLLLKQFCQVTSELVLMIDCDQTEPLMVSDALIRHLGGDIQPLINYLLKSRKFGLNYEDLASGFNCQLVEINQITDSRWLYRFISDSQQTAEMQLFIEAMKTMQEVAVRLSKFHDPDELLKEAVREARQNLYFDRLGFMLLNDAQDYVVGSWGTDRFGKIVQHSQYNGPIEYFHWVEPILDPNVMQVFMPNTTLYDDGEEVGYGWNLAVAIWDGEKVLGWIACDNLFTQLPIADWHRELFSQFGRVVGHLYAKARYEQSLRQYSSSLEDQVEKRSLELAEQMELLRKSQQELVDNEKLATLGSLVAGIAHEVNTPIGISVTAASHLEAEAKQIKQAYDAANITRSALEQFIGTAVESTEIILGNLNRASDLMFSFKRLTADQTSDFVETFNVHELIDHLVRSFQHRVKNKPITIVNGCKELLFASSYPGHVSQIFTNLLNNALVHAFDDMPDGQVELNAAIEGDNLVLSVADTGRGIDEQALPHIFKPFYTTKREQGGTGLGLNVIYNLAERLNGTVTAEPVIPHGVKFVVTLPLMESTHE